VGTCEIDKIGHKKKKIKNHEIRVFLVQSMILGLSLGDYL